MACIPTEAKLSTFFEEVKKDAKELWADIGLI